MRTAILGAVAWAFIVAAAGCVQGAGSDAAASNALVQIIPGKDGAATSTAPGQVELACHHPGGDHGGHGDHDVPDASVGDEGVAGDLGAVDPGPGPGPGTCSGPFEMRATGGPEVEGYTLSSWRSGPFTRSDQPLLYVIGIYESTSAHGATSLMRLSYDYMHPDSSKS